MGALVVMMSFAGWLKAQFSLVTIYGVSGFLFFCGMLLTIPLFSQVIAHKQELAVETK
jgi:MFS transporter, DHA3 family, macrolide efflux protein